MFDIVPSCPGAHTEQERWQRARQLNGSDAILPGCFPRGVPISDAVVACRHAREGELFQVGREAESVATQTQGMDDRDTSPGGMSAERIHSIFHRLVVGETDIALHAVRRTAKASKVFRGWKGRPD
eukprot:1621497-Rhodomonas_salina.2